MIWKKQPVGSKLSDLQNNKASKDMATQSAAGLMSAADKTKLDGIATGATAVSVVDNLNSDSTTSALSAAQGKALNSKITKHSNSGTTTCDLPLNARNVVATVQYGTASALQALSFVFPIGVANASISRLTFTQGYYLNTTSYAFCQISYNSSTEKITIVNLTISGVNYSSTSEISVTYDV